MNTQKRNELIIILLMAGAVFTGGLLIWFRWPSSCKFEDTTTTSTTTAQTTVSSSPTSPYTYPTKPFDLETKINGLSKEQIDQHKELYAGYVKKRNEIAQSLKTVDRSTATNKTFSPYRSLKIAETYATNGSILHELYFENLGKQDSKMGPEMQALIKKSFGSLQEFKEDLMAAAQSSHGWVLTAFTLDDGLVHNYVLEAHNQTVPVLSMPLLVLDVYEHAYMIDFGIKRAPYLDVFWENIDWDVVEDRVQKWVKPFQK